MTEQELLCIEADSAEFKRMLKAINSRNVSNLDSDIGYLKDWGRWEARVFDDLHMTVVSTFLFSSEDAAKSAIRIILEKYAQP